jgi:hypothetical protein
LGFDRLWLSGSASIDYFQFRLLRVVYCPDEQRRLVREYLEEAAAVWKQQEFTDHDEQWFWSMVANRMDHLVVAFKDPVFKEEREWRLVSPSVILGERSYRRSGHRVVPYIEIPIQEDAALTSLVRGPYFVNDRGSNDLLHRSRFHAAKNIRDSKIPLRP